MISPASSRIAAVQAAMAPFLRFLNDSPWMERADEPSVNNFVFGNPHEMPLPSFVDALQRSIVPQNKSWFAYKTNEPAAQAAVAAGLRERSGMPFAPEDILLTNGGFAALAVTLCTILDHGDEVLYVHPPWFFYEALIVTYGGTPVPVAVNTTTFDLDLDAIKAAITDRTRAIIINSPHNPTGRIYPAATLERLAQVLTTARPGGDRPIYLISDEAYNRIIFDGRQYPSPTSFYPHSFLMYTYGKTLLTPGQRIGYIALPPTMPDREQLRSALFAAQVVTGFAFPNALLQHAIADLERLSIDIEHLQRKRDRLTTALQQMGYQVNYPEGTFYLLPRAPVSDDVHFCNVLATHDIFCLPGTVVSLPGYFRISLTASDEMIDRALPGFALAIKQVADLNA